MPCASDYKFTWKTLTLLVDSVLRRQVVKKRHRLSQKITDCMQRYAYSVQKSTVYGRVIMRLIVEVRKICSSFHTVMLEEEETWGVNHCNRR